uniref:DM2 domain-containing protein n=1 Tax=viral metagenome TaxID=1070528 RepID=A0A6C0EVR7_9ZZZZ
MVKATKTKTSTPAVESVVTPVVESVSVAPAAKTPKAKAPKAKAPKEETKSTSTTTPTPTPITASTPTPTPTDAAPETAEAEAPLAEQSIEFLAKLQQVSVLLSSLKADFRALEKRQARELKAAQKQGSRRKRKAGNRAPSGFVKPTRISDELASFLGKDKGSEMARTEVTRDINVYIRQNALQDASNGRKINPDDKLATLLKFDKSKDELTYFNLQKYMSCHFAKNVKTTKSETIVA